MFKNILLASIMVLCISQFSFSQGDKTFSDFGISFQYSDKYTINSGTAKEGYQFVNMQRQGSNITVQIFPVNLTQSLRDIYLSAFEGELKKGNNVLSGTAQKEGKFTVNDYTVKGGRIKVKAILYETNFTTVNNITVKTKIFFFSYRKRGYVIAFSFLPALKHGGEFNKLTNSVTIK